MIMIMSNLTNQLDLINCHCCYYYYSLSHPISKLLRSRVAYSYVQRWQSTITITIYHVLPTIIYTTNCENILISQWDPRRPNRHVGSL